METKTNEGSSAWLNISIHQCIAIYIFPNSILIQKILWIDSGKQRPPTTCCPSPDTSRSPPPAAGSASTLYEGRRAMRRGNTGGAAEAGRRCLTYRSFGDCKVPLSPLLLYHVPAGSTLLWGGSVSMCYPLASSQRECGRTAVMSVFMSDKNVPRSPRNNDTFSA